VPDVIEYCVPEPNVMNRYSAWDIDFRQIGTGPMETNVLLRPGANVTLLDISMSNRVHQKGCSPSDAITLALPSSALRSWNGTPIGEPCLVNFGTAREFDCVNDEGFYALTISISLKYLTRLCDRLGLPHPVEFMPQTALPLRRFSTALSELQEFGQLRLFSPDRPFGEAEQEDLVVGLICATAVADCYGDRSTLSDRAKSVRNAVAYIEDNANETPRVSDICSAVQVPWRTLDRGFKEYFGIGPKAYVNRLRLVRVRSALLQMRNGASIADVANAWGFWHMGQFARDYFRMFGELPSDTLAQNH
jgi:AraC family ethanolamine operon transcriptional activator